MEFRDDYTTGQSFVTQFRDETVGAKHLPAMSRIFRTLLWANASPLHAANALLTDFAAALLLGLPGYDSRRNPVVQGLAPAHKGLCYRFSDRFQRGGRLCQPECPKCKALKEKFVKTEEEK